MHILPMILALCVALKINVSIIGMVSGQFHFLLTPISDVDQLYIIFLANLFFIISPSLVVS